MEENDFKTLIAELIELEFEERIALIRENWSDLTKEQHEMLEEVLQQIREGPSETGVQSRMTEEIPERGALEPGEILPEEERVYREETEEPESSATPATPVVYGMAKREGGEEELEVGRAYTVENETRSELPPEKSEWRSVTGDDMEINGDIGSDLEKKYRGRKTEVM